MSWSFVLMLIARASSEFSATGVAPFAVAEEALGVERLGSRLKTSCRLPRIAWLTGSSPSMTFCRYLPMSCNRRCRPWRDLSCDVIRVDSVPTATSLISRRRCSTPISSASSASMVEGVCTNSLDVVEPSWPCQHASHRHPSPSTHISDLLNRKVCIRRHPHLFRLHIDNDEKRIWCVSFEQLVDSQIRSPQLRTSVVPSYQLFPRIHLLEHVVHRLDVVVIDEPY